MYTGIKKLIQREYLTCAVFGLFLFLTFLLAGNFLVPSIKKYGNTLAKYNYYRSVEENRGKFMSDKKQLVELKNRLEKKREEFNGFKSRPENVSESFQRLFDIAWNAGFKFDKITPGDEEKKELCMESSVLLNAEITFDKLGKFLTEVENLPGAYNIYGLACQVQENGLLAVKIKVKCYTDLT